VKLTLPVGPIQVQDSYYAGSRLGIATYGAFCWGTPLDNPTYVGLVGRCIETGAQLSIAALQQVISLLPEDCLGRTQKICCWSDSGSHFRSWGYLGSLAAELGEGRRRSVVLRWLAEHHGKSRCGGLFGHLGQAVREAAKGELLTEVSQAVAAARRYSAAGLGAAIRKADGGQAAGGRAGGETAGRAAGGRKPGSADGKQPVYTRHEPAPRPRGEYKWHRLHPPGVRRKGQNHVTAARARDRSTVVARLQIALPHLSMRRCLTHLGSRIGRGS
jgi:hypothetical protein